MLEKIETIVATIKQTKPLILCLTNYVTMDFMANSLLALGAAPIMSEDIREMEELVTLSGAINLNIGTLDESFLERARSAAKHAKSAEKPIIFDPVGVGASYIRSQAALEFITYASIIRGNASEIMAFFDTNTKTLGVESMSQSNEARGAASELASKYDIVVTVSGKEDLIIDKSKSIILSYGSSIMKLITGMGCTFTAVVAAFRAVYPSSFDAAMLASAFFGLCGQQAAEESQLSGSFRTHFIDALHKPDWKKMRKWCAELKDIDYKQRSLS